ncbi:phospholipase D-like domain-containing protein [Malaciobacter mytili]|uniref:phospholipase D-like domain-containing protein n=1 Tax=Malaciobacter mytili TaxID=603050 RepID=UPI0013E95F81|nr:phospholipase D-like domain-containing protein [Malaciobacter mytili]
MRVIVLFFIFFNLSFSSQLYFLPKESKEATNKLITLIEKSSSSIDIAVYNFTYKKLAKALKDRAKKGVKVTVILDKEKVNEEEKTQYKYLKKEGINIVLTSNKLHIKMAIFDKKTALFGSANWKKDSFTKDYEILYFTDENKTLDKLNSIFKELEKEN